MPLSISSTASGSLAPPQVLHPETSANGDFRIQGSSIGPAIVVGDGNDERTTWTFDFSADANLAFFDPFRGLTSALLTLTLTPGNLGISTDLISIQGLPPIITPIIQGIPNGGTSTINIEILNFPGYDSNDILSNFIQNNNTISMSYGDDAIVSAARLELTQDDAAFLYPVKFVCGEAQDEILSRGTYFTAINIHNPNTTRIRLRYKAAVALPGEPGPISPFRVEWLAHNAAFEINCRHVRALIGQDQLLMTGFVVIESEHEVDVVAVYTAGAPQVTTLHTERVAPRRGTRRPTEVPIPADVPLGANPGPE